MKIVILSILSIFFTTNAFAGKGFSSSRSYSRPSYSRPSVSKSYSRPASSSYNRPSTSASSYRPSVYKPSPSVRVSPPINGTYKRLNAPTTNTASSYKASVKPTTTASSLNSSTTTKKAYSPTYASTNRPRASFSSTYLWSAATGSATMGYLMGGSLSGALLYSSLHSKHTESASTQTYNVGDKVSDGKETLVIEKITKGEEIALVVGTQVRDEKGTILTITNVAHENGETTYTLSNGTTVKGTKHERLVYTFTNGSKAMDMSHFKAVK